MNLNNLIDGEIQELDIRDLHVLREKAKSENDKLAEMIINEEIKKRIRQGIK